MPLFSVPHFAAKFALCCLAGSIKINCFQMKREINVRKRFFLSVLNFIVLLEVTLLTF